MIRENNKIFYLETLKTEYIIRINEYDFAEHVYYGARLNDDDILPFTDKMPFPPGNVIELQNGESRFSPEHFKSEYSEQGKGDVKEISFDMIHSDGSRTCDFRFNGYEILNKKYDLGELPSSYGEADTLVLKFIDKNSGNTLELLYAVFEQSDVITRASRFTNNEENSVKLRKIMSSQIDLDEFQEYEFVTFNGSWANEMNMSRRKLEPGIMSNASFCGNSSNRMNPFCMICSEGADENNGDVYAFNLIYSGNHYESVYVDIFGKVRFVQGINPAEFEYVIDAGTCFVTPEAVITYSEDGFSKITENMHSFVRNNIVRGSWQYKERPILINSWESYYFNFNESKLLSLAKDASKVGIELFVIDDGWFKGRNDDTSSLGDWEVDEKKLPHGLSDFADKLKKFDMMLGIWVEPEMVNENSDLYRKHPEYAVRIPNKDHALGRNQMLLNLTMPEVQDYIIESMTRVFNSADIKYVKWDMNRVMSDTYGTNLDIDRQLEFSHRYVLGLYKILDTLTKRFPDILFESCSSGGNRFDLGMLCYMPQTWASDNTDAKCRVRIQTSYSYGYPQSVIGAHVSACPNHQTLRVTPVDTRFAVAGYGCLGYECDFNDFSKFEMEQIASQIEFYKQYRKTMQFGKFYRLLDDGNRVQWFAYDEETDEGIAMFYQHEKAAGLPFDRIKFRGLREDARYSFESRDMAFSIKDFGSLVNTISPIHIKQNSLIHNMIDKIKHLDSEKENYSTTGNVLMKAGIKLKEGYAWGYNENIRYMPDNGTRMYVIKKEQ